jgi:hypothetical protein
MNEMCPGCGLRMEREPGFYLGAIYFNYGLTALAVTIAFPLLTLTQMLTSRQALFVCMAFVVIFPLAIFRLARSFWLAFDEMIDPQVKTRK